MGLMVKTFTFHFIPLALLEFLTMWLYYFYNKNSINV